MRKSISNEFVTVEFDDNDKSIIARDLKDIYNEPTVYNQTKIGYKKVKKDILTCLSLEGDRTTLSTVANMCRGYGMRVRYYCAVD